MFPATVVFPHLSFFLTVPSERWTEFSLSFHVLLQKAQTAQYFHENISLKNVHTTYSFVVTIKAHTAETTPGPGMHFWQSYRSEGGKERTWMLWPFIQNAAISSHSAALFGLVYPEY
jgi:hypothetical protein